MEESRLHALCEMSLCSRRIRHCVRRSRRSMSTPAEAMTPPPAQTIAGDVAELRRALRDLVTVSMLPSLWTKSDARAIAESLAQTLTGILELEFLYVRIRLPGEERDIHVAHSQFGDVGDPLPSLRAAFAEWIGKSSASETIKMESPLSRRRVNAMLVPMSAGNSFLVAAARRSSFPTVPERLLLEVGANQAAISIGRWQAERELFRLNETLEQRVASEIKGRVVAEEAFRQAQKMEAIGQLTGGIAHDFNNILTAIFGSLEMVLASEEADDATRRLVATALRSAGRGARLTQQLLAFARRQVLQPKLANLNDLLLEMRVLMQRAVGEAVEISFSLAKELPSCLIDPAQLETAMLNLVINARDAMPEGGAVRVETAPVSLSAATDDLPRGDYVRLSVADTGVGMSPEVAARAFEPFFTTKETGKGSGLGLSMVYGFAKQSAGALRIDSAPGRGTTVSLFLPVLPALARAQSGTEQERPLGVVASGSGTVLLVEDNEDVRSATAGVLSSLGYRVIVASHGKRAIELLRRRGSIDLLLTDLVMPGGMSGVEVAREARRLRSGLPVLLMSGYSPPDLGELGGELNCAFIHKPFRPAELGKAISDLLHVPAPG
jgi:signal transduction histidine kinase